MIRNSKAAFNDRHGLNKKRTLLLLWPFKKKKKRTEQNSVPHVNDILYMMFAHSSNSGN